MYSVYLEQQHLADNLQMLAMSPLSARRYRIPQVQPSKRAAQANKKKKRSINGRRGERTVEKDYRQTWTAFIMRCVHNLSREKGATFHAIGEPSGRGNQTKTARLKYKRQTPTTAIDTNNTRETHARRIAGSTTTGKKQTPSVACTDSLPGFRIETFRVVS